LHVYACQCLCNVYCTRSLRTQMECIQLVHKPQQIAPAQIRSCPSMHVWHAICSVHAATNRYTAGLALCLADTPTCAKSGVALCMSSVGTMSSTHSLHKRMQCTQLLELPKEPRTCAKQVPRMSSTCSCCTVQSARSQETARLLASKTNAPPAPVQSRALWLRACPV
jgi:hypothetical protein